MDPFLMDEGDLKSNVWTCSKYPTLNREVLRQDKHRKCDFNTKSAKTFKIHLQRLHQSHEFPKSFLCPVRPCTSQNKVFPSSKDLRQHYACIHGPAELLCPVCGKMLRSPKSYKRHVRDCKTGVFTCSICNIMYSSRTSLVRHQKLKNHPPEAEVLQVEVTESPSSSIHSNNKVIKIKQDYILVPVTKLGSENYAIFHNNKLFQLNNPNNELVPANHHETNYRDHVHYQDKEVGTSQTYNNQGSQYHINQTNQASQHQITQNNQASQHHGPGSHQSASEYPDHYHGPHQSEHHHITTLLTNQGTQHERPEVHSQASQYQQNNQASQYHGPGSHQSAPDTQYHGPGSHQSAPDTQYQVNQNQQTSQGSQHQGSQHQGSQHQGSQHQGSQGSRVYKSVERYNQSSQYQDVEHQGVQCDLQQGSYSQWMGTSLINPFSADHNASSESDEERVFNDRPLYSALDNIHTQTEALWNINEFSTQTVTEQQSFGTQTACESVLESLECVESDFVEYLDCCAQTDTAKSGKCFGAQTEAMPSPSGPGGPGGPGGPLSHVTHPHSWPHDTAILEGSMDQSSGVELCNTECQTFEQRNSTHTQTNMLRERVLQVPGMNNETQTAVPSYYNESFTQTQDSFELQFFPK